MEKTGKNAKKAAKRPRKGQISVEYIKTDKLTPYANNPRNNDAAVDAVAASIKSFGFRVPCVVDRDNVIVTGHTRLKAAIRLGMKKIPCIRADDLTPEQIKAFRLADNKVGEIATWNDELLDIELGEIDLDMSAFGFDLGDMTVPDCSDISEEDGEGVGENYAEKTQFRRENILNLGYAQFEGVGDYDIPPILPVYELPPIKEWIGFNYVLSDDQPEGKGVHFFCDDYQFERIWNEPDRYIEKLKRYSCVASPDFSPYTDMPFALQVFNHYRKHWVGRYLQENGVTVIPTIRSNLSDRCFDYFLEGEPENSIIIISSMWGGSYKEWNAKIYKTIRDKI